MKKFSKILSVALLVAMVLSLGITSAFADDDAAPTYSLTINRDSSWQASTTEDRNATFTYYKVFDAKDIDKTAGTAVYTVDSAEKAEAIKGTGLFNADLAADGSYYVTLKSNSTGAADIAAALKTMVEANTKLFPGASVTSEANPVIISGLKAGYYLLVASNGSVLGVQTLDNVTINEKNDYPKLDKQEKKANGTWVDTTVMPAELNTYIDYKLEVKVPANANQAIYVYDKMTEGLTYDTTSLAANVITTTDGTTTSTEVPFTAISNTDTKHYVDGQTWQIEFAEATVKAHLGETITITYRALVNDTTLEKDERNNTATLKYDDNNYVITDHVDYTTYFGGIYKVDPNDAAADMAGVKFTLTLNDAVAASEGVEAKAATPVKVRWVDDETTGGYYVVDPNGTSNEVETKKIGDNYVIRIRGLDNDKTYILTETETKTGYNLLKDPVTLTKTEDKGTAFADKLGNTFDRVENNKGSVLPSTGGIGTTIFYVVGGVLVLAAIILLVTKKRMSE